VQEQNCKKHVLSLMIGALCTSTAITAQASDLMLEEVVVTVQKRTQSLQDVPMSVSALDSNAMLPANPVKTRYEPSSSSFDRSTKVTGPNMDNVTRH
jgi:hypothetical protein